eukprot:gnl/Trimastix_PCT/3761.p1 GENE.gnl/Trimastix_PCT/3761~~gnl/Trimastix_PCT/3761.p1  ORF type:complete len:274 (-),score=85.26 gnl/Trimastix_PCT/3761:53-874(-)
MTDGDKLIEATTEPETESHGTRFDNTLKFIKEHITEDPKLIRRNIEKAHSLLEEHQLDWERKNRLIVYEAAFSMVIRDFHKAAALFLESLATFNATELFSYEDFVFYTVVTALNALPRPEIRAKVVHAPEILAVIHAIPHLEAYLNALYKCQYREFFCQLGHILERLRADPLLAPHATRYGKEMRVIAYTQYLQPYHDVALASMAREFGVSEDFLDADLARFICLGKVHAKINRVTAQVITVRSDSKMELYTQTRQRGDMLFDRINKLASLLQ